MALKIPTSMDDLLYFTNRKHDKLSIRAWVYKKQCPKCKKALMGKPVDPSTGKVKIRSTEYICPSCGFTEPKKPHEESLTLEAQYTCPACAKSGEASTQYKRKTFQGVPAVVIECSNCHNKIPITKKMKEPKKKKVKDAAAEEIDADEL